MKLYSPDITKPTEVNYYWHEKVLIEPMPKPKQGEWQIRFPYKDTDKTRTCSNCNITQTVNVYEEKVRFRFCPYCGARMKGVSDG